MAVQTRINPNTGILEYFDDGLGQAGEFTTIPQNRLDEFAGSIQETVGSIPTNYAGFAPAPEGQQATIDPNTGLKVFTPIPMDPAWSPTTTKAAKAKRLPPLTTFVILFT